MMKIIDDDKEAEKAKQKLEEELKLDKTTDEGKLTSFEINWLDHIESYYDGKDIAINLFQKSEHWTWIAVLGKDKINCRNEVYEFTNKFIVGEINGDS